MISFTFKWMLNVWLLGLYLLLSSSNAWTESAKEPLKTNRTVMVSKVKALSELIASDQPSFSEVLRILGGNIAESECKKGLVITGDRYKAVVKCHDKKEEKLVSEVLIYLDSELWIRFKDLKEVLGEWKKIHQGKTSSVLFKYSNPKSDEKALIYVHMAFPPSDANSPVFLIDIRKEFVSFEKRTKVY